MIDGSSRCRPCPLSRYTWKPRLRISWLVFHSTTTPPPGTNWARNDVRLTAVGDTIVEVHVELAVFIVGSLVVFHETVAVLTASVVELNVAAVTLIVIVTNPPTLIGLRLHVIVAPGAEQVPSDDGIKTELNVTSVGKVSVTETFSATSGPLSAT